MNKIVRSLLLLLVVGCKSKSSACANVSQSLDPITKDLDAIAASADTAPPPSPADQASCGQLTDRQRRIESAQAKLALVVADDATLAKHLDAYRKHVDEWARATKKAQTACLSKDGNAMTAGISEAIKHRSQLTPAAADITTYCKGP